MPDAPIQEIKLTIKYPPAGTQTGGASFKDQDSVRNFGDSALLNLEQGDVIDVKRTHNPARGKYPASFTIVSWKKADQQQAAKPFLRARTDPHDQMNMFVTALMKEWMTAYGACLMFGAEHKMHPVDGRIVLQAMEAFATTYRQFHGIRTQSGEDLQEDIDEIPEYAR